MPDDFFADPGSEPPATVLDPSRSQRFVMLNGICKFGNGTDGFRGFGTGRTFPVTINGKHQLWVAAIGTIIEGFGKFRDYNSGTYNYCGSLSVEHGFVGSLMIRVMDPNGRLQISDGLSTIEHQPDPEAGITYIVLRGEAAPTDQVTPRIGPDGQPLGLIVEQGVRLLWLDCKDKGRGGLQSVTRVGQIVGQLFAKISFDPTAPGGTLLNPIPFTTWDEFTFFDRNGQTVGGFVADLIEGRVFNISVGGEKAIRFGGIGSLLDGTGTFSGIEGLMTDNSVVIFTPHVSASVYILRISDPDGRFSSALDEC